MKAEMMKVADLCDDSESGDNTTDSDDESLIGSDEASKPPPPPPAKARVAYLDHVKLICMTSVWWIHGLAYGSFYCRFPEDDWGEFPTKPSWMYVMVKMLHKYNMSFFALCSGAVSYHEATPDRMANAFASLIMPCVLIHLWLQFTWYAPGNKVLDQNNLFKFMTNAEPWYMKTLFAWRILLFCFGQFSDIPLMCFALGTRMVWQVSGSDNSCLLSHVVNDAPFFVAGHILVRRRKLLQPYVDFLSARRWLQVSCFLAYTYLWIDVLFLGLWDKADTAFFDWFPDTILGKASKDVFRVLEVFLYGFIATGWLPTSEKPIISSTGKYTLYAYLMNYHAIIALLALWKYSLPHASDAVFWTSWLAIQPFFTMFLCSEPVRFIMWPIAQPSWFGKDWKTTRLNDVCDVDWVKKVGFAKWAAAEVAFHAVWISCMLMFGMPWRDECEKRNPPW